MKVKISEARKIGSQLGIDFKKYPISVWREAMNIELEHGSRFGLTNVTNDDLQVTGKIALAHILEFPDYYQRLIKMEMKAEKFWKNKKMPNIFK